MYGGGKLLPPAGTPAAAIARFLPATGICGDQRDDRRRWDGETTCALKELAAKGASTPREDAMAPLAGLGDADVGLAVIGDADSRRVVARCFRSCRRRSARLTARLLADGVRWAGISATLPPKFQLTITADAATPEIAKTLERAVGKAMVVAKAVLTKESIRRAAGASGAGEGVVAFALAGDAESGRDAAVGRVRQ